MSQNKLFTKKDMQNMMVAVDCLFSMAVPSVYIYIYICLLVCLRVGPFIFEPLTHFIKDFGVCHLKTFKAFCSILSYLPPSLPEIKTTISYPIYTKCNRHNGISKTNAFPAVYNINQTSLKSKPMSF